MVHAALEARPAPAAARAPLADPRLIGRIALIAATVPASLRATGQALLVMSINLGGAIGNAISGRVYDAQGSRLLFLLAAVGELAPLGVVLVARARLRSTPGLISSRPS